MRDLTPTAGISRGNGVTVAVVGEAPAGLAYGYQLSHHSRRRQVAKPSAVITGASNSR